MQGVGDSHAKQTMFMVTEIIVKVMDDSYPIRVANAIITPRQTGDIFTKETSVSSCMNEVRDVRYVPLEVKEQKGLGGVSLTAGRMWALLDPRRTMLVTNHLLVALYHSRLATKRV